MFNLSRDEITFEKVKDFCKNTPEGVQVEYKSEIPKDMPKTLSSFANTHGGVLIIGVEPHTSHNVIKGIPKDPDIKKRIEQIGRTGINPPVMPEVIIKPVPDTENIVIVVRVDESVQAPHDIENATYIRLESVIKPYELESVIKPYELAKIGRVEYLLTRRQDTQKVTQQILDRIEGSIKPSAESEPTITIVARPVFPYRQVILPSKIRDVFWHVEVLNRLPGGICITNTVFHEYGFVYRKDVIHENDTDREKDTDRTLNFQGVWSPIHKVMQRAKDFYSECGYLGNIQVSAELKNVRDMNLSGEIGYRRLSGNLICSVPEFRVTTRAYLARDFRKPETRRSISKELLLQILWAFNVPSKSHEEYIIDGLEGFIASAIK